MGWAFIVSPPSLFGVRRRSRTAAARDPALIKLLFDLNLSHRLIALLVAELPPPDYPGAVDGLLTHAANEGLRISARIVGRLCVIAATIETALGLPLGESPSKDES